MSEAESFPVESRASFETSAVEFAPDLHDRELLNEDEKRNLLIAIQVGREAQGRLGEEGYSDTTSELNIAIKRGQRAESVIVETHNNLVWKIARSFHGSGMSIDDFVQEGRIGLLKAAREYDPNSDELFHEYAAHRIKDSLMIAIEKSARVIRLPKNEFWIAARMRRVREEFLRDNDGRQPTDEELADRLNTSTQVLANLSPTAYDVATVLDAPLEEDDDSIKTLKDVIIPEAVESSSADDDDILTDPAVVAMFGALTKTQRQVFERRASINGYPHMSNEEIAAELGVTSEHIKQTEKRGRRRLRIIMTGDQKAENTQEESQSD